MSNKLLKSKKSSQKANAEITFFNHIGYIFIILGIASFILLGYVSLLPQDYEKYNVSLFFAIWTIISLVFLIIGLVPLVLGKYCKRYQTWAEKELLKQAEKIIEI